MKNASRNKKSMLATASVGGLCSWPHPMALSGDHRLRSQLSSTADPLLEMAEWGTERCIVLSDRDYEDRAMLVRHD